MSSTESQSESSSPPPEQKATRKKKDDRVYVTTDEELQRKWVSCERCELSCFKRSNGKLSTVVGEGPVPAEFLLVGERPGVQEERTGIPMCGKGGDWTWAALARAGIEKSRVYSTNILGCVPPKTTAAKHVKVCIERVEDIVDVVQPKAIITVGKVAANKLTGQNVGMSTLSQTIGEFKGIEVFCVTHPFESARQEADHKYEDTVAKIHGDIQWLRYQFASREWVEREFE